MRSIFSITLVLSIFGCSFAGATELPVPPKPAPVSKCPQGKCDAFIKKETQGPVPYAGKTICVPFVQLMRPGKRQMMIQFFNAAGQEIDKNDPLHTKNANYADQVCPARHWWVEARGGYVKLCNEDNHISIFGPELIDAYLANGGPQQGHGACLLGKAKCAEVAASHGWK